jgi:hypothetical protein
MLNNLFLTIGAMGTCMFSKFTIDYRVLWKSIKVVESAWGVFLVVKHLVC